MNKVCLKDITLNITDGKHGDCEKENNSGFYFLSVKDIDRLFINYDNARQITYTDFTEANKRTQLEAGDTIYANSGDTIGKSLFIKDNPLVSKSTFQKSVAILKPNPLIVDPRYFYYLLKHETERLRKTAVGSAQKNLLLDDLRNFETQIHDKDLQVEISDILGNIEDRIENIAKMNQILDSIAQTIYDYWFVQFDFPDKHASPYKKSGGKMVWCNELSKEIPAGWKVQTLNTNEISELIKPGVDEFEEKIYLATADVVGNDIVGGSVITYHDRENRANMQPVENSVWFAKMKNSPKHLYFGQYSNQSIEHFILSTGFCGLKCKEEYLEYFISFINNPHFEMLKDMLSHGATQQAVNNQDLDDIPVIIPSVDVIHRFHDLTEPIFRMIFQKKQEIFKLLNLRDFLLPMLMNGQVTFKNNKLVTAKAEEKFRLLEK